MWTLQIIYLQWLDWNLPRAFFAEVLPNTFQLNMSNIKMKNIKNITILKVYKPSISFYVWENMNKWKLSDTETVLLLSVK